MKKPTLAYPNIKAELARYGYSVKYLAEWLGMSRQNLDNKIKGKTAFNEKDMKAIQEFFIAKGGNALTLDYLFATNL